MTRSGINTSVSVRDEYAGLAGTYDRRWQRYLDASACHTLAALTPRDGERILDVGCGTGLLLRRIAAHAPGAQLAGVDITPAMLRQVEARLADRLQGDIRRLPLADATFDAVIVASVLHYLPAVGPALAEVARVLRPGGRVVITVWDGDNRWMRLLRWWLKWRGKASVQLHTQADLFGALGAQRLQIIYAKTYFVGPAWRLCTLVGFKDTGGPAGPRSRLRTESGNQAPVWPPAARS